MSDGFTRTPDYQRIADYPAHWARTRPGGDAVVEGGVVTSHAAFERLIQQVAAALLAAGVRRGDRVAMLATPRLEHLAHFMAATRIGSIWLGLNPRFRLDELAHVLRDSQPRLVVAMLDIEGRDYRGDFAALRQGPLDAVQLVALDGAADGFVAWDRFLLSGADMARQRLESAAAEMHPDDVALIVYTSGSTGAPKGAMLSQRSIVTSARIQCEHWWAEPFRLLNNMPINHIGGAVQLAGHAIVAGGTQVLMRRFDPLLLPGVIREARVTVIHQVPTMYQLMLEKGSPAPEDLGSLQLIVWSGAAAPRPLIEHLRRLCPQLFTSYGMTETGAEVLYTPPGASDEMLSLSVGLPVAQIPLRLGSLDGNGPADGHAGEIQVQGPTMMSGYFNQAEATAAAFTHDGWLRTGDIGERFADGSYRITGRLREMYKSGGYNVYPREVELVIEQAPGVSMAAVVGVQDAIYGEVGHAWVACGDTLIDAASLESFCRERLANFKVPKRIHLCRELPMLANSKVDKVLLRQWSVGEA
jgi:acyl-CoA synthetase (AMP-forming)/AMP-acid ligase II